MDLINPNCPDEITPDWLSAALKKSGTLSSCKVAGIKIEAISEGRAWLSYVLRLKVVYEPQNTTLPQSFVLKMLSKSKHRDPSYELDAYKREINFYNNIAPTIPIRLPRLFYSVSSPDCNLMLMEDMSYLSAGDLIGGIKYDLLLNTIEQLAKVHASCWNVPELISKSWIPLSNDYHSDYTTKWDSFIDLCGEFIEPSGISLGESLKPRIGWLIDEILSRPSTLVHDDMKADNLLFDDNGAVVILDWQFVIKSMAVIDVVRLIGGSMKPEERKGREFDALNFWYGKLLENGVKNYKWEEAQRDFKLGALYCLTFPVHFHEGITRAQGRALEYVKALYSRLFQFAVEIGVESVFPSE